MINENKVESELLATWQTVGAIAYRANVTNEVALYILLKMHGEGKVKHRKVRISDNDKRRVYFFRKV